MPVSNHMQQVVQRLHTYKRPQPYDEYEEYHKQKKEQLRLKNLDKNFHERLYVQHTRSSQKKSQASASEEKKSLISAKSSKIKKTPRKKSRSASQKPKPSRSVSKKNQKAKSKTKKGRSKSASKPSTLTQTVPKLAYQTARSSKLSKNPSIKEHEYYHNLQKQIKTPRESQTPESNYSSGFVKLRPVGKFIDEMRNSKEVAQDSPQGCFKSAAKNDAYDKVQGFYLKKKKLKKAEKIGDLKKQAKTQAKESKEVKPAQSSKFTSHKKSQMTDQKLISKTGQTAKQFSKTKIEDGSKSQAKNKRKKSKGSQEGTRQKTVPGNSFIELLEGEEKSLDVSSSNIPEIQGLDKKYNDELHVHEEEYKSDRFRHDLVQEAQETIDKLVSDASEAEMDNIEKLQKFKEDPNVRQEKLSPKNYSDRGNQSMENSLSERVYSSDKIPNPEKPISLNFPVEQPGFVKPQTHPSRIVFNSIPNVYVPKIKDIIIPDLSVKNGSVMKSENFMLLKMDMMNTAMSSMSPSKNFDQNKSKMSDHGSKEPSKENSRTGSRANSASKILPNEDNQLKPDPINQSVIKETSGNDITSPQKAKIPLPPVTTQTSGSGAGGQIFRPTRKRNNSANGGDSGGNSRGTSQNQSRQKVRTKFKELANTSSQKHPFLCLKLEYQKLPAESILANLIS